MFSEIRLYGEGSNYETTSKRRHWVETVQCPLGAWQDNLAGVAAMVNAAIATAPPEVDLSRAMVTIVVESVTPE
jgi:hypothetical protein